MTRDNTKFLTLTTIDGGTVTFGGKDKDKIIGKGNIKLGNLIVEDVSFVKGLKHNLIDISQPCDKGYKISFEKGKCIGTSKDNSQSFTRNRYDNIYSLDINFEESYCLMSIKEECNLWHKKLCYINAKWIQKIS